MGQVEVGREQSKSLGRGDRSCPSSELKVYAHCWAEGVSGRQWYCITVWITKERDDVVKSLGEKDEQRGPSERGLSGHKREDTGGYGRVGESSAPRVPVG